MPHLRGKVCPIHKANRVIIQIVEEQFGFIGRVIQNSFTHRLSDFRTNIFKMVQNVRAVVCVFVAPIEARLLALHVRVARNQRISFFHDIAGECIAILVRKVVKLFVHHSFCRIECIRRNGSQRVQPRSGRVVAFSGDKSPPICCVRFYGGISE